MNSSELEFSSIPFGQYSVYGVEELKGNSFALESLLLESLLEYPPPPPPPNNNKTNDLILNLTPESDTAF